MFRKDYTIVVERFLPVDLFFRDLFIKVGTGIAYSEKLRTFVDSIPKVIQQQYKKFVDTWPFRCQKVVCDTITRANFVAAAT